VRYGWLLHTCQTYLQTGHEFALKIQNKDNGEVRDDAVTEIRREIDVLKQIHHPFIVNLVHVYENDDSIDMLLGLIPGGELWDQIHVEDADGIWTSGFSESRARFITYVLADTLSYLHSQDFLFRDLKPENVMIDKDGYPVLVDFGFAKHVPKGSLTFTFCGTPNYVAPEIIRNTGQSIGVDHWALGVVIYEMISGENPFFYDDMGQIELFESITLEEPYPMPEDRIPSPHANDIIDKLLRKNPKERLGYDSPMELLLHPWFEGMPDLNDIRAKKIKAPTDNDLYETMYNDEESVASFHEPNQDIDSDTQEDQIEAKPKSKPTKWLLPPKSKGELKGYFLSPRTPSQKRNSEERRELLNKKLIDVIALEPDAL
jgi:serine/threonine protein kinase